MKTFGRVGQTMVEYVIAVLALIVVASVMVCVINATKKHVDRTESLVRSDYP